MLLKRILVAFFALSLTGCETKVIQHGLVPNNDELALIKPGLHKRSDVRVILGPPSTIAQFEPRSWYYVGSQVQKEPFAKSSLLARKIVEVRFNSEGYVTTVKSFDSTNEKKIKPAERITATGGKQLTIIQQLIGNAGRFTGKGNEAPNEN